MRHRSYMGTCFLSQSLTLYRTSALRLCKIVKSVADLLKSADDMAGSAQRP